MKHALDEKHTELQDKNLLLNTVNQQVTEQENQVREYSVCKHWNYLLIYLKFPMMHIHHSVNSDWLFNTQSRVLRYDWFIVDINEKAVLDINMAFMTVCMLTRAC